LCLEHGVPEAECAICLPNLSETLDAFSTDPATREFQGNSPAYPKVRLGSKEAAAKAGLRAVRVGAAVRGENLGGAAEIVSDDNHSSPVASPVGGIVRAIRVNVGDRVTA